MRKEIQDKAVEVALANKSGTLALAVRTGKTLVGLRIASNFKKVLVSYPNISIKNSWLTDAEKFNIPIENITFTTHLSLNKCNLDDFDVVILDEIDQVSEAQITFITDSCPKRLYGLSGTPAISGVKKVFMDVYCPIIYEVKLDETVGTLQKDYEIIVHLLEPNTEKNIKLSNGGYWSEKAKIEFWDRKYQNSRNFMDMLKLIQSIQNSTTKLNYLKKLSNKIDRCLIFLETQKQCDDFGEVVYHSKEKKSEANLELFQAGFVDKLVCCKQLSSGITFKSLNEVIILHAYASNNKTHQRLARCLNYVEGEKATIHVIGLKGTRDEIWISKGLAEFDQSKIKYETKTNK